MEIVLESKRAINYGAAIGFAMWMCLAMTALPRSSQLGLIEILFLLAPAAVLPLAASLVPAVPRSELAGNLRLAQNLLTFPAGALAAASFFLSVGNGAGILASAWLLVCCLTAVEGLVRILRCGRDSFAQLCFGVGQAYLLIGGSWLVISRLGLHPFGFDEPIVLLTAVHFHFAGFASAVLAGLTFQFLQGTRWAKFLRAALFGVVAGPALLCVAFLVGPKLKLVAALFIVAGQFGLAAAMLRVGISSAHRLGRWLLILSSGCVVAGMAFAATWATGEYPLHPFVNLSRMTQFHGVLNALGFTLCGLLGWRQVLNMNHPSPEVQR